MKPVAIDLCCGLGGWTAGLMSEGWDVIGFDIERHEYGDKRYPAQLILKSILELNGYDLRAVNPSLVVASPPCQEYSYMAMPWQRGKQIAAALRNNMPVSFPFPEGYDGSRTVAELTALFDACFRIAREIGCPIVLENVKGAQPWVGRANAHYGSYYLWGDVGNVGGRVVRADRPARFGEYVRPNGGACSCGVPVEKVGGPHGTFPSGGLAGGFLENQSARGVKVAGNDTFKITGKPCGKLTDSRYPSGPGDGVKIGGSGDDYWRKPLEAKRREATAVKNGGDFLPTLKSCHLAAVYGLFSRSLNCPQYVQK
jgi:hypothetical protein